MGSWADTRRQWQSVPFDQMGYSTPDAILASGVPLRVVAQQFEANRYGGWRNYHGLWAEHMGFSRFFGRVLDYGCGSGIEGLQYAKSGNEVSPADINSASVYFACQMLMAHGYQPGESYLIRPGGKLLPEAMDGSFNLVVMSGVLHHIEDPLEPVSEAYCLLREGGELRLMVYTDRSWRAATGTEPPQDVRGHPQEYTYRTFHDGSDYFCDWYDADRIVSRFGDLFELKHWEYIGQEAPEWGVPFGRYGIAILGRKP